MGYFGNRSSGGIKQYASGIAYMREIDGNTNQAATGSGSAWTQIGYFRNSKISLESGSKQDYYDDGNNLVTSVITNPQQGTVSIDLMERDESVRQTFTTTQGKYYQFVLIGATLTYSGSKKEVWVSPYCQVDQGFEYSPSAQDASYPLKLICTGAKVALTNVALPASLSASNFSASAGQIFYTADV